MSESQAMPLDGLVTEDLEIPSDVRAGIGESIKHALMFARSMTDIVIQEGRVIVAKSARGTRALHELIPGCPSFIVTREHIIHYLAGYVEGDGRGQDPEVYWREQL